MGTEEQWLLDEKHNGETTPGFFTDVQRLQSGEPLGYIIGYVPFLDCQIHLDSRPLIPRPETEYWTEIALQEIADSKQVRVLDLCAGSGCIGVSVRKALQSTRTNMHVDFAEIDITHHATIHKNLTENVSDTNHNQAQSSVYGGDLFAEVPSDVQYDFILANPPYIDPALDRTDSSVRQYEPHNALYGGELGIELVTRIIAESSLYLSHAGQLWVEHEPEQSVSIAALAEKYNFLCTTHKDQYDLERYSILMLQ
ncbi:MAG: release factor glutamine methyltransferase [Candidatus Azotimanducaceae bacterium]|jgi:release factor glutamine methyltransferase